MAEAKRGFAALNPEQRRKIASKGGRKVHATGNAYQWTSATAKAAGRKGGLASRGGRVGVLGPKAPKVKGGKGSGGGDGEAA